MPKYIVFWKEYHHEEIEAPDSAAAMEQIANKRKEITFDGFAEDIKVEKQIAHL